MDKENIKALTQDCLFLINAKTGSANTPATSKLHQIPLRGSRDDFFNYGRIFKTIIAMGKACLNM